jgi:hypothetical protein
LHTSGSAFFLSISLSRELFVFFDVSPMLSNSLSTLSFDSNRYVISHYASINITYVHTTSHLYLEYIQAWNRPLHSMTSIVRTYTISCSSHICVRQLSNSQPSFLTFNRLSIDLIFICMLSWKKQKSIFTGNMFNFDLYLDRRYIYVIKLNIFNIY